MCIRREQCQEERVCVRTAVSGGASVREQCQEETVRGERAVEPVRIILPHSLCSEGPRLGMAQHCYTAQATTPDELP